MDLKPIIDFLVTAFTSFAATTTTKLDDTALGLLKALQTSPALLDWLGSLLKRQADIPGGALAQVAADDPELDAAFNASPAVKEWAMTQREGTRAAVVPDGAKPLAIGSVLALLKYLPTLLALLQAARDSGILKATK